GRPHARRAALGRGGRTPGRGSSCGPWTRPAVAAHPDLGRVLPSDPLGPFRGSPSQRWYRSTVTPGRPRPEDGPPPKAHATPQRADDDAPTHPHANTRLGPGPPRSRRARRRPRRTIPVSDRPP